MKTKEGIEVEDGQEFTSRTIVGGRPLVRRKARINIHAGIEKALYRAAIDPGFRRDLLEDRLAALRSRSMVLTAAEETIFACVPRDRLELMIDEIRPDKHGKRRFMKAVATAVMTLASTTATVSCMESTGVEADVPEDVPVDTSYPDPAGDAPDLPEVEADELDVPSDLPEEDLDDEDALDVPADAVDGTDADGDEADVPVDTPVDTTEVPLDIPEVPVEVAGDMGDIPPEVLDSGDDGEG